MQSTVLKCNIFSEPVFTYDRRKKKKKICVPQKIEGQRKEKYLPLTMGACISTCLNLEQIQSKYVSLFWFALHWSSQTHFGSNKHGRITTFQPVIPAPVGTDV